MVVKKYVKALLAQEDITLKEIASLMTDKTGKSYSMQSLSHKMRRGTLSFDDVLLISEILGYKIEFKKEK